MKAAVVANTIKAGADAAREFGALPAASQAAYFNQLVRNKDIEALSRIATGELKEHKQPAVKVIIELCSSADDSLRAKAALVSLATYSDRPIAFAAESHIKTSKDANLIASLILKSAERRADAVSWLKDGALGSDKKYSEDCINALSAVAINVESKTSVTALLTLRNTQKPEMQTAFTKAQDQILSFVNQAVQSTDNPKACKAINILGEAGDTKGLSCLQNLALLREKIFISYALEAGHALGYAVRNSEAAAKLGVELITNYAYPNGMYAFCRGLTKAIVEDGSEKGVAFNLAHTILNDRSGKYSLQVKKALFEHIGGQDKRVIWFGEPLTPTIAFPSLELLKLKPAA